MLSRLNMIIFLFVQRARIQNLSRKFTKNVVIIGKLIKNKKNKKKEVN